MAQVQQLVWIDRGAWRGEPEAEAARRILAEESDMRVPGAGTPDPIHRELYCGRYALAGRTADGHGCCRESH